jgi:YgiT-type zinc finger domain-containing protein
MEVTMAETEAEWEALSQQLAGEVAAWRREHPRASFNEIEDFVDERMNRLRAKMIADVAAAVDVEVKERPVCPECGKGAVLRGKKRRRLRMQGGEQIELERHHAICPHCGTAFFPPG